MTCEAELHNTTVSASTSCIASTVNRTMGKQKQRSDVPRISKYCEQCHCYVSKGSWQQHTAGIRHRRSILELKYGGPVMSQFECVPQTHEDALQEPSHDVRSLVAALVGTGGVYHKALKTLSRVCDLRRGRVRVEEAARGKTRVVHRDAQFMPANPLDLQIAGACVDVVAAADPEIHVDEGDVPQAYTVTASEHAKCGECKEPDPDDSGSQLMIMDTDGPTLMCLAEHLGVASYSKVCIGVLQPMQTLSVKATAAMAALICVMRAMKSCYEMQILGLNFQLNHEEAKQAMNSEAPPIPKPVIEELQGLVTCHALWIKDVKVSRQFAPGSAPNSCNELRKHWQLLRKAEVHDRRLAFLMGRHARLGLTCPWQKAPEEALQIILGKALPLHCQMSVSL